MKYDKILHHQIIHIANPIYNYTIYIWYHMSKEVLNHPLYKSQGMISPKNIQWEVGIISPEGKFIITIISKGKHEWYTATKHPTSASSCQNLNGKIKTLPPDHVEPKWSTPPCWGDKLKSHSEVKPWSQTIALVMEIPDSNLTQGT